MSAALLSSPEPAGRGCQREHHAEPGKGYCGMNLELRSNHIPCQKPSLPSQETAWAHVRRIHKFRHARCCLTQATGPRLGGQPGPWQCCCTADTLSCDAPQPAPSLLTREQQMEGRLRAPDVGSSRKTTRGAATTPHAMLSRRFSPPERPRTFRPPGSRPPTCAPPAHPLVWRPHEAGHCRQAARGSMWPPGVDAKLALARPSTCPAQPSAATRPNKLAPQLPAAPPCLRDDQWQHQFRHCSNQCVPGAARGACKRSIPPDLQGEMPGGVWAARELPPVRAWLNFLRCRPMERSESSMRTSRSARLSPRPGRRRLVLMDSVSHTLSVGMNTSSCARAVSAGSGPLSVLGLCRNL